MGGEDVGEHFLGWGIGGAGGELGEGFGGGEAAALASAEVVAGKEGAAGTREGVHDFSHGGIDAELGGIHGGNIGGKKAKLTTENTEITDEGWAIKLGEVDDC